MGANDLLWEDEVFTQDEFHQGVYNRKQKKKIKKQKKNKFKSYGYNQNRSYYLPGYNLWGTNKDDDDYSMFSTPQEFKATTYQSTWSGINWGSYSFNTTSREEILKAKKDLESFLIQEFISSDIKITDSSSSSILKGTGKIFITLPKSKSEDINIRNKIIKGFKKLNNKDNIIFQLGYNIYLFDSTYGFESSTRDLIFKAYLGDNLKNDCYDFFEGRITRGDFISKFDELLIEKAEKKHSNEINNDGSMKGFNKVKELLRYSNDIKGNTSEFLKMIRKKIVSKDEFFKEKLLYSGKRINRGYLEKRDYHIFTKNSSVEKTKKKLFIIIDGSGSMHSESIGFDRIPCSDISSSFTSALVASNLFDIQYVYYHNDNGYGNCIDEIKKNPLEWNYYMANNGEGFEYIEDNIPRKEISSSDYVILLTDLLIGESAKRGLLGLLQQSKKHLILSFKNKGNMLGLNVRQITNKQDMINSLVTLIS